MLLQIRVSFLVKHRRSHIFVLDAFVGQDCRRQPLPQIHAGDSLEILLRDLIVTFPDSLQLRQRHFLHIREQMFRPRQENGRALRGKNVRLLHLLGRRDDNLYLIFLISIPVTFIHIHYNPSVTIL